MGQPMKIGTGLFQLMDNGSQDGKYNIFNKKFNPLSNNKREKKSDFVKKRKALPKLPSKPEPVLAL